MSALLARHGRAIAREADGHIVSSSPDARFLHERLGVPEERIAVIAQAAPDSYLRHAAPPMTPQRLRNILHVAQFAFFKAPMVTIAAINSLARRGADFRFTWVCDRNDHARIRSMLTAPANEKTTLLAWMGQEELRAVYDDHGIFLFPSFFEGFGKAFLEAMSRGLCVVASDAGGMHDLIDQGRNGILVPPGEATDLAEAAQSVAADVSGAAAMSEAAARTAREYTWERVAAETAAFYARLLAVRG
jgi:glycosyltransferase involved in cell wall biosynthesis